MPELADVVIVGGGVLGTALAYELSWRSLRVTLVEANALASGTTGSGFGWVNATSKEDDERYHRLCAQGVTTYEALAAEWGAETLGLHGGGALYWAEGDDATGIQRLRARATRLQGWGYPVCLLNAAEIRALEPQAVLRSEAVEGLFAPADGWLDAGRCTRFLANRARKQNADIREYCPATGFSQTVTGHISTVETPQGRLSAPLLVLAAGAQTASLAARILRIAPDKTPFAVKRVPGVLVETPPESAPGLVKRVLYPPDAGGLHLRPTPGGGLLLGADDMDAALTPENEAELLRSAPEEMLTRAARVLRGLPPDTLQRQAQARLCVRPIPQDDRPIVGPLPGASGVFVAVTHSGYTLGPLLAQLLAQEIVSGSLSPLLTPYRPSRFLR